VISRVGSGVFGRAFSWVGDWLGLLFCLVVSLLR